MKKIKVFLLACALALSFAILTCFVSNNLWSRFEHRQDVIDQQFAILKGEPYRLGADVYYWPMFQNRVLFAYALKFAGGFGILPVSKAYLVLRLFSSFLAMLVFFYSVIKTSGATYKTAAIGMMLMAYELVLSFNHGFEHPPDFLDVLFVSLFLWVSVKPRPMMLLAFALLGSLNRESCVFAGVIWFFVNGLDERYRIKPVDALYGLLVSVASYASAVVIRFSFGAEKITYQQLGAGLPHLLMRFKEFMRNPTNSSWPVLLIAMLIPLGLWIWSNRSRLSSLHFRLLFASVAIVLMSQQYARLDELRTMLPALTVAVWTSAISERGIT